jgi:hypothetical protein
MPTETTISRSLAPSASFSLRTSRTFRIGALSAGIGPPLAWPQRGEWSGDSVADSESVLTTLNRVAGFARNTQLFGA